MKTVRHWNGWYFDLNQVEKRKILLEWCSQNKGYHKKMIYNEKKILWQRYYEENMYKKEESCANEKQYTFDYIETRYKS